MTECLGRFEVLTAVLLTTEVFWDAQPSPLVNPTKPFGRL
jgi:hypothetical protein